MHGNIIHYSNVNNTQLQTEEAKKDIRALLSSCIIKNYLGHH